MRSYNEEIEESIYNIEMHNLTFSCYACDSTKSWKLASLKRVIAASKPNNTEESRWLASLLIVMQIGGQAI